MALCNWCTNELDGTQEIVFCGKCNGRYHSACTQFEEKEWKNLSPNKKKAWRCGDCVEKKKRVAGEWSKEVGGENPVLKKFETMLSKEMKTMKKLMEDNFKEYEKSLNFQSGKLDEISVTVKDVQRSLIKMEERQDKLEKQNEELRTRVKHLETLVQENQQERNNCKLEITGAPANVDPESFVKEIFKKVNVDQITDRKPYKVEKYMKNPEEPKCLVVKFDSDEIRDSILEVIRRTKPTLKSNEITHHPGESKMIFMNEYLTPYYKKLFFQAKQLKKDKNYDYLWVRKGHVLLKKNNGAKVMRLSCLDDLKLI